MRCRCLPVARRVSDTRLSAGRPKRRYRRAPARYLPPPARAGVAARGETPPLPARSRSRHPSLPPDVPGGIRSALLRGQVLPTCPLGGRARRAAPHRSRGGRRRGEAGPAGRAPIAAAYRRCLSPSWAPFPGSRGSGAPVCRWMPMAPSRSLTACLPPSLRPPSSWQGGWESAARLQHMPSLRSRPGPSAINQGASQAPPCSLQLCYSRPHRAAGQ